MPKKIPAFVCNLSYSPWIQTLPPSPYTLFTLDTNPTRLPTSPYVYSPWIQTLPPSPNVYSPWIQNLPPSPYVYSPWIQTLPPSPYVYSPWIQLWLWSKECVPLYDDSKRISKDQLMTVFLLLRLKKRFINEIFFKIK